MKIIPIASCSPGAGGYHNGNPYGQYGTPQLFDGSSKTVGNVYCGTVLAHPADKNWSPKVDQASEVQTPVPGASTYQMVHSAVGNPPTREPTTVSGSCDPTSLDLHTESNS